MPMLPVLHYLKKARLAFLMSAFLSSPVWAQQVEIDHSSHHPGGTEESQITTNGDQPEGLTRGGTNGGGNGMGAMMDEMMEKMGAPTPKDLYPSLMRFPELTIEQRENVGRDAQNRMQSGVTMMMRSFADLSQANNNDDFESMQSAIGNIEQGLAQYDSGLAAKRALAEGLAPRNVALQWFKGEMSLLSSSEAEDNPFFIGMSPLHTSVMMILLLFAALMVWMYLFKMRRAAALLGELRDRSPLAEKREPAAPLAEFDKPSSFGTEEAVEKKAAAPSKSQRYSGPLKVIGIFDETHDVKTFRMSLPDNQPLPFTYEPGQFLTFTLKIPGQSKPIKRSYTIASSPTQRDFIELTIKREQQGVVSRFLHDEVKLNDLLEVKIPSGNFYFNGQNANSVVLIAGGVGITPMMSAARYLMDTCWDGAVYFLFCARSSNDFIFQQELTYLQARHKNLHVLVSMTRAEGTSWMGPQGRFTAELINNFVPEIASKEIHICGPQPMMDGVSSILKGLGVSENLIKTEAFGAAPKVKKAPAQPSSTMPPKQNSSEVSVKKAFASEFVASQKTATMTVGETVLEAAEALDIEIENSCRAGSCGSCMIKLLSGKVQMEVDDALEEEQKGKGYILACQAIPSSDIKVEA